MRWQLLLVLLIVGSFLPLTAEDWTTLDGKTYKHVTNIQPQDDGVTITYEGGTAKIPLYNLPVEIQKQLGQDLDTPEAKKKAADEAADAAKALAAATQKRLEEERTRQAIEAARVRALTDARHADKLPPLPGMFPPSASTAKAPFAGADYNFDKDTGLSYLDSAQAKINLVSGAVTTSGNPASAFTSISLRSITQGLEPESSPKVLVTLIFNGAIPKITEQDPVTVLADGNSVPVENPAFKVYDALPGVGQVIAYLSFSVDQSAANKIFNAKSIQIKAGNVVYSVDTNGVGALQQFLQGVSKLPPPPSYLVQKYREFIYGLPAWPTLVSRTCIYIILVAAGLLIFFCFSALYLGVSRFLKM